MSFWLVLLLITLAIIVVFALFSMIVGFLEGLIRGVVRTLRKEETRPKSELYWAFNEESGEWEKTLLKPDPSQVYLRKL